MSNVGDLGRRVAERRRELGLSPEAVATRAGMDRSYFQAVETSSSPQLSRTTLVRLAAALETTVNVLTGAGTQAPPGRATAGGHPALDALDPDECEALVGSGGVGRVVFSEPRGPVALPVNFRMLGGDVVFRTAPLPALTSALGLGPVSFEVDHIDDALVEGWSVLLTGWGHEILDAAEQRLVETLGITPWAGGEREVYVRIVPSVVTGRRIRNG
jgi:transcriptional regulator with XRE-family HTH domain